MQVANDYRGEVLAELPRGSDLAYSGAGIRLTVQCAHGHGQEVNFNKRFPADAIRRLLSTKGWKLNGKRASCPIHAGTSENTGSKERNRPLKQTAEIAPSPNAKMAKREALRWLDDSFDTVAGRYKDDLNDAKIGELTGLSAKAVADLRAEFGYDLKTPPEIAAIRVELQALQSEIAQWGGDAQLVIRSFADRYDLIDKRLTAYEAKA